MAPQNNRKRPLITVDLTGSSPERGNPSKHARTQSRQLPTPSSSFQTQPSNEYSPFHLAPPGSSQNAPARSQASQFRQDEDGGNELVDDDDRYDDMDQYVLYGSMPGKVVGCRYYNGTISIREMVVLNREPTNQYDSNAIRVDNVRGDQIGHIPRAMAAKLAPFMDDGSLIIEAATTGYKDVFDCPIGFKLFGTNERDAHAVLKERMKAVKLPLDEINRREKEAKARQKEEERQEKERQKMLKLAKKGGMSMPDAGGNMSIPPGSGVWAGGASQGDGPKPPSLDDIVNDSVKFNPRNVEQMAEQFGIKEADLAAMPFADQPEAIKTKMLPYQLQGLKWLLDKERPILPAKGTRDVTQLWKRHDQDQNLFSHLATNFAARDPALASCGILGDDMGMKHRPKILYTVPATIVRL